MAATDGYDLTVKVHERLAGRRLVWRVVALAALSVAALVLPGVGTNRIALAATLALAIPVALTLARYLPPRTLHVAQPTFDVAAATLAAALEPSVWAPALLVVVASPAASAAIVGRRGYVLAEAIGLGGFAIVGMVAGVEGWHVSIVVGIVLCFFITRFVDTFRHDERTAAGHLADVVETGDVVLWEIDARTLELLGTTGRTEALLGWTRADLDRLELIDLVHPDDLAGFGFDPDDLGTGTMHHFQGRIRHRDGHWVWIRNHVRAFRAGDRLVLRGVVYDITPLVEAHEATRARADRDDLTGLHNRHRFLEELAGGLATDRPVALLLLDFDGFKELNDTLGHHLGDVFLHRVGARLPDAAGSGAQVARLGGDEFAFLLVDPAGLQDVLGAADRIAEACSRPVDLGGIEFSGTASIGVALAPDHGTDVETLLRRADTAMYAAKRTGQRIHVFDPRRDEPTIDRLALSADLERAFADDEFRLWFQPKIDVASGRTVGVEGLVRWHHPERGVLLPSAFVDLVALSRRTRALTLEVLRQGIAFAERAAAAGTPLEVSLNITARDLLDTELSEHLAELLTHHRVDPSRLVLEVTEQDIVHTSTQRFTVRGLTDLGIGLSVDDFGTGHSSLVRLQELPLTELKIDRRFVAALGFDPDAEIIVESTIELAHRLGLRVVAEGVERPIEAELLATMGADQAQGFLYAPALPADEVLPAAASLDG